MPIIIEVRIEPWPRGRTDFDEFMQAVEGESAAAGDAAALAAYGEHFQLALSVIQLRKKQRWTQQQLAKASGVQQSEISRIERGQGNPTYRTLQALAQAVEMTVTFVASKPARPQRWASAEPQQPSERSRCRLNGVPAEECFQGDTGHRKRPQRGRPQIFNPEAPAPGDWEPVRKMGHVVNLHDRRIPMRPGVFSSVPMRGNNSIGKVLVLLTTKLILVQVVAGSNPVAPTIEALSQNQYGSGGFSFWG